MLINRTNNQLERFEQKLGDYLQQDIIRRLPHSYIERTNRANIRMYSSSQKSKIYESYTSFDEISLAYYALVLDLPKAQIK